MRTLIKVLSVLVLCTPIAQGQEVYESYDDAYARAIDTEKPLMVVLSARWCGPCKVLKQEVLDPMREEGAFSDVIFVELDVDKDPLTAAKIFEQTKRRSVPQIIVWHRIADKWKMRTTRTYTKGTIAKLLKLDQNETR